MRTQEGAIMGADDVERGGSDVSLEPLLLEDKQAATQKDGTTSAETRIEMAQPEAAAFAFNSGRRPYQDTTFSILFLATMLAAYALGMLAVQTADPAEVARAAVARFDRSTGRCEVREHAYVGYTPTHFALLPARGRQTYETTTTEEQSSFRSPLFYGPVTATALLALPGLGAAMLWILHRDAVVLALVQYAFLLPFLGNLYWFASCQTAADGWCDQLMSEETQITLFVVLFVVIALSAWVLYTKWSRIELTITILRTAAQAVRDNIALVTVVYPALSLVTLLLNVPLVVFILKALENGKVAPDFAMVNDYSRRCGLDGGESCCKFRPAAWVPAYLTLAGFAMLWTMMVANQLQRFTTSGTIAQWYFAPAGSSTVGTTKRALGNAFGPSFGTVCFSGLVVAVLNVLRHAANSAGGGGRQGIISILVRACLTWILRLVVFLTNFASNFAAITGSGFCAAATMTHELLRRHLLSTLVVEVLAGQVLGMIASILALFYSVAVFEAMELFTNASRTLSAGTAAACFVTSLVALLLFNQVLHAVVDAVYICYAMDKDAGTVSKPDVHDVYVLLPASAEDARLAVPRANEP